MTIFRLKSDLHGNKDILEEEGSKDIHLVLCGDIHEVKKTKEFENMISTFCSKYKSVIFVAGNHEYYTSSIFQVNKIINSISENYDNFYFLNDSSIVIDDVIIIGSTLWVDFNKRNPQDIMSSMLGMQDYKYIRIGPAHEPWKRKLSTSDVYVMHKNSLDYISETIQEHRTKNPDSKILVITHHAPSTLSNDEKYCTSNLNYSFSSNLEENILDLKPNVWCHGHIHCPKDYYIADTRILCNPLGHGHERQGYDSKKDFEI